MQLDRAFVGPATRLSSWSLSRKEECWAEPRLWLTRSGESPFSLPLGGSTWFRVSGAPLTLVIA
jgi:hypothetical protein